MICEFHDTVNVQTDFNAQVSFLPELLKTYMKSKVTSLAYLPFVLSMKFDFLLNCLAKLWLTNKKLFFFWVLFIIFKCLFILFDYGCLIFVEFFKSILEILRTKQQKQRRERQLTLGAIFVDMCVRLGMLIQKFALLTDSNGILLSSMKFFVNFR